MLCDDVAQITGIPLLGPCLLAREIRLLCSTLYNRQLRNGYGTVPQSTLSSKQNEAIANSSVHEPSLSPSFFLPYLYRHPP
jgi:hypothetical protein